MAPGSLRGPRGFLGDTGRRELRLQWLRSKSVKSLHHVYMCEDSPDFHNDSRVSIVLSAGMSDTSHASHVG